MYTMEAKNGSHGVHYGSRFLLFCGVHHRKGMEVDFNMNDPV